MTKAKPKTTPLAAATPAAPAVPASTKGKRTYTVACNFPAGLEIQLCKETTWMEDTPSGSRQRTRFDRVGPTVVLRGPARPNGPVPKGYRTAQVAGGYGLTPNVDADFFDEWLRQNKDNPVVVNKVVFAQTSRDSTISEARENKDRRTGFEPLIPPDQDADGKVRNMDPRMPRPVGAGLTGIATADEMADRQPLPAEADVD